MRFIANKIFILVVKEILCIIILGITITHTNCQIMDREFACFSSTISGKVYSACYGSDAEKLTLPESVPRNVQELHMEAFQKSSIVIRKIDLFGRFANLSVLDIRTGRSFSIDENLQKPDKYDQLRENLFNLPNLEKLMIQYEEFNEKNNSWVLPPKLKELHLHNSVFEFDIYSCSVLEKLMFTNNKLKKIPHMRDPPPPLKVLSLSFGNSLNEFAVVENSLDEFTVDDIAPLCKLQRLEFVMYASGEDRKKGCECYRLQEWITDLKLEAGKSEDEFTFSSDVYLYCPKDNAVDCWNYTLDDARKKRDQCLWSNYGIIPKSVKRGLIVFVLVIIVVVVMVMSYGLHCFRSRSKPIGIKLTLSKEYFNCSYPYLTIIDDDAYPTVLCESASNKTLLLPQNIYKNVHFLNITSNRFDVLMIEDANTFKRFSNLKIIQLRLRSGFAISILQPIELERLNYELFNLPTLLALDIEYSEFNVVDHQWILPKSLKIFRLSNSVFEYNLSRCSELRKLIVIRNELNKMPILSNPPPPLKELVLRGNPLREFGANDIAGYCDLRFFTLLEADLKYCECVLMIQWIKKNIKDVEGFKFVGFLECNNVEDSNCTNDAAKKAEFLVEKCLDNGTWSLVLFIFSVVLLIVISVLVGLLIWYSFMKLIKRNESGEE